MGTCATRRQTYRLPLSPELVQRRNDLRLESGEIDQNQIPDNFDVHFFVGVRDSIARPINLRQRNLRMPCRVIWGVCKQAVCRLANNAEVAQNGVLE